MEGDFYGKKIPHELWGSMYQFEDLEFEVV